MAINNRIQRRSYMQAVRKRTAQERGTKGQSMIRIGCYVGQHEREGGCYNCCESCNYASHRCPGCGSDLTHDGRDHTGNYHFDCIGEYETEDGRIVGYTEFGQRVNAKPLQNGIPE